MKRFLIWSTSILLALIVAIVLACRFTPWPSVAIISYVFSRGDRASEAALEKHVPAGIAVQRDVVYGSGKDELLDLYYPAGTTTPRPAIVWVHGGGFVAGSKQGVANYMKVLAGHGYTVIAVEYSRGYGSTYPRPVAQVNRALGYIVRNAATLKVNPARLVLAGDSAGAHIACQVAMITTNPAYAGLLAIAPQLQSNQLAAVLLLSGAFDPTAFNLDGKLGWFVRSVLWAYLGTKNFRENAGFRQMSVAAHVTAAFPPSFISSGNGDPLAPQAVALAQQLNQLGVPIDALFFPADRTPSLPHEYQFNLDDPAGQQALTRMLGFLDRIGFSSPIA